MSENEEFLKEVKQAYTIAVNLFVFRMRRVYFAVRERCPLRNNKEFTQLNDLYEETKEDKYDDDADELLEHICKNVCKLHDSPLCYSNIENTLDELVVGIKEDKYNFGFLPPRLKKFLMTGEAYDGGWKKNE